MPIMNRQISAISTPPNDTTRCRCAGTCMVAVDLELAEPGTARSDPVICKPRWTTLQLPIGANLAGPAGHGLWPIDDRAPVNAKKTAGHSARPFLRRAVAGVSLLHHDLDTAVL